MTGKDVPTKNDEYMHGYAAGTFDTLEFMVWYANEASKDFNAATFTPLYQCLQKIPNLGETVAWAKDYWAKNPKLVAANELVIDACQYKPGQARTTTMVRGGEKAPSRGGTNRK